MIKPWNWHTAKFYLVKITNRFVSLIYQMSIISLSYWRIYHHFDKLRLINMTNQSSSWMTINLGCSKWWIYIHQYEFCHLRDEADEPTEVYLSFWRKQSYSVHVVNIQETKRAGIRQKRLRKSGKGTSDACPTLLQLDAKDWNQLWGTSGGTAIRVMIRITTSTEQVIIFRLRTGRFQYAPGLESVSGATQSQWQATKMTETWNQEGGNLAKRNRSPGTTVWQPGAAPPDDNVHYWDRTTHLWTQKKMRWTLFR
jgi:hypothetical protein